MMSHGNAALQACCGVAKRWYHSPVSTQKLYAGSSRQPFVAIHSSATSLEPT